jgi:hypothetical protein
VDLIIRLKVKNYIPLFYSEKIKRPDKKFFLYTIVGEDLLILLLSFTYFSSHPWFNAIGLFLLQIAFWCIYELGYIENDIIGEKFEETAVLSHNYKTYKSFFPLWQPWLCSFVLSALGIIVLSNDLAIKNNPINFPLFNNYSDNLFWISQELIYWMFFLLVLRGLFHVYNHINKQSRVWFYLLLQACRYCGFLVILTTNTVGLILLLSMILTRSIQYIVYRYLSIKNSDWPVDFPRYFFCLLIYLLILGVLAANERDFLLIANPQVVLISAFCLARGAKHFLRVFTQLESVQEDGSNKVT